MTIIHNFLFIFLLFYAAKVGIPLQTNEHFAKINAFSAIRQPLSILEMPCLAKKKEKQTHHDKSYKNDMQKRNKAEKNLFTLDFMSTFAQHFWRNKDSIALLIVLKTEKWKSII